MSHFSLTLKTLRKQHGLTQQQLADMLQVSKSRINMYERGEREPNFEMLHSLGEFFNVDMNYLLGSIHFEQQEGLRLDAAHGISGASEQDKIDDEKFFDED